MPLPLLQAAFLILALQGHLSLTCKMQKGKLVCNVPDSLNHSTDGNTRAGTSSPQGAVPTFCSAENLHRLQRWSADQSPPCPPPHPASIATTQSSLAMRQPGRHHNKELGSTFQTTDWWGHRKACIRQRPRAVCHGMRAITLSGMLDSESKPRNLTLAVSQMASSKMATGGSCLISSYEGSYSMVAGNSPPRNSLTKVRMTARMGHTLHATRSGRDAVQFRWPASSSAQHNLTHVHKWVHHGLP